ncbi:Uncharacterised protein [Bacteroides xylanisolvens]|nr:Uncharacterised protein [Bacteroides xylanisolvens]
MKILGRQGKIANQNRLFFIGSEYQMRSGYPLLLKRDRFTLKKCFHILIQGTRKSGKHIFYALHRVRFRIHFCFLNQIL